MSATVQGLLQRAGMAAHGATGLPCARGKITYL